MKLWRGPGPCCGGGSGAGELELVSGVTGDGVRTVPQSVKATVELFLILEFKPFARRKSLMEWGTLGL